MTTITPDPETEEGQKLLEYAPGDEIKVTMTVQAVKNGRITAEETACEPAEEESAAEDEAEGGEEEAAPEMPMKGGGMPKAIAIIAKK